MQEESLQPITVGAFYGLQCPRPFLLACEKPPIEEGPEIRKPPSLKDSPYCALAGQNSVFLDWAGNVAFKNGGRKMEGEEDTKPATDKEEAAKPTRTKRAKRSHAPRPPPRAPRSAYNFYIAERASLMKAMGDKVAAQTVGDFGNSLKAAWEAMSDAEKKPYATRAAEDAVRFIKEKHANDAGKSKGRKVTKKQQVAAVEEEEAEEEDSQEEEDEGEISEEEESDEEDDEEQLTPPTPPVASSPRVMSRGGTKRTAARPAAVPSKRITRASRK